ncbi:MAG: C40 family peptidase [Bacteroidales bacterium]|nr:C40 family peptidase [Bacteroidales bacterium]
MYGVNPFSIIPVRSEPSERSEMVTQLLFGETFTVLDTKGNWVNVMIHQDNYQGWIDSKMMQEVESGFIDELNSSRLSVVDDVTARATNNANHLPVNLVRGSILPFLNNGILRLGQQEYTFEGTETVIPDVPDTSLIPRVALSYLNTPYLWGGKTPFGIDCSGLTQMVFRRCGINLLRDASQQANQGTVLSFLAEAEAGDLVFFDNEEGKIIHVGIYLGDQQLIHSTGSVRIDTLDHEGIFNRETGKYTHKLRIIKRVGRS